MAKKWFVKGFGSHPISGSALEKALQFLNERKLTPDAVKIVEGGQNERGLPVIHIFYYAEEETGAEKETRPGEEAQAHAGDGTF